MSTAARSAPSRSAFPAAHRYTNAGKHVIPALATIRLLAISLAVTLLVLGAVHLTWHPVPQRPEALRANYILNGDVNPEDQERALYSAGVAVFCSCAILLSLALKPWRPAPSSKLPLWSAAVWLLTASLVLAATAFCFTGSMLLNVFHAFTAYPIRTAVFAMLTLGLLLCECRFRSLRQRLFFPLVALSLAPLPFLVVAFRFDLASVTDIGSLTDHFNALFDSVAQVYQGKTVLMGSAAQYGLYSHLLAPFFRITGLSVSKFSLTMGVLLAAAYACLFLTLAGTIRRGLPVFLTAWSLLYASRLYLLVQFRDVYFQYTPLRLLFPALLVYTSHRWFQTGRRRWFYCSHLVAGLAPWWNLDSGLACVLSWHGALFLKAVTTRSAVPVIRRVARMVLPATSALILIGMTVLLWLRMRGGRWPDLALIVDFNRLVLAGFTLLPMPLVHPWNMVLLIYAIGFVYGVERWSRGSHSRAAGETLVLSMLGITLFVYYQGRSHDFNLLLVWWPAWMIGGILMGLALRDFEARLRLANRLRKRARGWWSAWLAGLRACDAGKALLILAAIAVGSATAPRVVESLQTVIPVFPAANGAVARRAETLRHMLGATEQPLVLSGHSGVLLNSLSRRQPVDVAGLSELFSVRDVSRIESWLAADPKAVVAVDNISVWGFAWSQRVLNGLHSRGFHLRSLSPDCEIAVFDKAGSEDHLGSLILDPSYFFGPPSAATVVDSAICGNRLALREPSGSILFRKPAPVSLTMPFTIQFIVKPGPRQKPYAHILGTHPGSSGAQGFAVQQNADQVNRYTFAFGNNFTFLTPLKFQLKADKWQHVAILITAAIASVYIDGELSDQAVMPETTLENSPLPLGIGNWIFEDRPFAGQIAAIRIDNANALPRKYTAAEWALITRSLDGPRPPSR